MIMYFRCLMILFSASILTTCCINLARAEHEGTVQILLLGDSTTEGSIPRRHAPQGPHLEDVIRELLAEEKDLPLTNVINVGLSGEYIRRLLDSGRYDKVASKLPGLDFILIRYGLNDLSNLKDFDETFPKDYRELLGRLKTDHPNATLIVTTVIPYANEPVTTRVNDQNKAVAKSEDVLLFDL